jgi:hypothetical protein
MDRQQPSTGPKSGAREAEAEPKLDEGKRLAGRSTHDRASAPPERGRQDNGQGRYGYGGFGHMGQSDIGDRRVGPQGGDPGVVGMERESDRYTSERYMAERYLGDRSPSERLPSERDAALDPGGSLPSEPPRRGKGPKNYTRSDERIREDISERLYADDHVDASEITITVQSGEVTLSGSVETRRMKHRAEDIADAVAGVNDVHNHLKVTRGVISQIAEKVQHGVEKLTGSSEKSESFRASADTSPSQNNRHHS